MGPGGVVERCRGALLARTRPPELCGSGAKRLGLGRKTMLKTPEAVRGTRARVRRQSGRSQ
eukprot:98389-Alexandrium_andersonii.AAC.1